MKNNILSNFQQISAFKDSPFGQFWEKRLPLWALETYGPGNVYNKSNFRIIDASKRFSDGSAAFYNNLVGESWNDIQFLVFAHPDGNQVLKDYADSKKAPKENEVYFFIETNDGKLDFGKIVRVKLGKKAIIKITSAYPLVSGWNQEDLVDAFLKRSFEVKKGIDYDFVKAGDEIKKNPEEFKNLLAKAIKYDYQQKKFDDMSWGLKFLQLTDYLGFSIPQKLMQLSGEMRAKKYSEEKFWNAELPKDFTPAFLPNAIVPEKRNNIQENILKNVKARINEITSYGKEAGLLEQVYKEILNNVLLYLFDKFSSALEEGLKVLDDILPEGESLNDLYNLNAFLVGLWNGCIEFAAGIVDLVALIIVIERDGFGYAISDKLTEQLENFFNEAIFGFEDFILKIWKKFNIAIKDFELWYLQYSDNSYYWYKTLGELTPDILTIVVPELAASKAAKVSKAGTVAAEVSEDVLQKSGKVLSEKLEQTTAKKEVKEAFEKAETRLEDNVPRENKIDEVIVGGANKKLFSIWKVNLKEGKYNCANCVIATDVTLAGRPASALPYTIQKRFRSGKWENYISFDKGTLPTVLEKEFSAKFSNWTHDLNILLKDLKPNKRGIVFGIKKGKNMGHYFNVVNDNGVIKYLDGQTGKQAKLVYDYYQFLPTN